MRALFRNIVEQHVIFRVVDDAGDPVTTLDHTNTTIKAKIGMTGALTTLTIGALSAHTDAYSSGGFKHIEAGKYVYHVPNDISGAAEPDRFVLFQLSSASVLADKTVDLEVELRELLQLSAAGLPEVEPVSWGADALDSMLDDVYVEPDISLRVALRRIYAALIAKNAGPAPGVAGTVTFRDPADGRNRITMPVDTNGYRTGPATFDDTE